jgi:protoheme IX farnesyltransferase
MPTSITSALELEPAARVSWSTALWATVRDLWTLTKPEVNFLIVIATFTGFYLALSTNQPFPAWRLLNAMCGTLLVASGTGALNQCLEYRFDARMRRTCRRPVAAGRVSPAAAAWFGTTISIAGAAYLALTVNALASSLAVLTLTSYLLVYTPLKRKTPLCTLAGAFPGAMPPLIGWAAASGSIDKNAWILYSVLFLWQFPHFMAIAWMYRDDYSRAGYSILPAKDEGRFLTWMTLGPALGLVLVSLAAVAANHGGVFQCCATAGLGAALLYYGCRQLLLRSRSAARELLKASILYLPLEFLVLILGKT